jgi:hypothetical protein
VLTEIAEYPNSFGPLGPRDERIATDRFTLCMGPGSSPSWNVVQRCRFDTDELDDVVREVHELLRSRGRDACTWEIGSSARPRDLVDRLLERGLVPDRDPYAVALVLDHEPPPAPPELAARPVETFEEYVAACAVQWEAFEMTPAQIEEQRADLRRRWEESPNVVYATWLDGELVAAGTDAPTEHGMLLYGGATLSRARGRGAYRALIGARWRGAVERGTPVLITQGGSMSRPILERLGFRPVGAVHMLVDDFGRAAS